MNLEALTYSSQPHETVEAAMLELRGIINRNLAERSNAGYLERHLVERGVVLAQRHRGEHSRWGSAPTGNEVCCLDADCGDAPA